MLIRALCQLLSDLPFQARQKGETAADRQASGHDDSEARKQATAFRGSLAQGGDPAQQQSAQRAELQRKRKQADDEALALAKRLTVRAVAERFLQAKADLSWAKRYEQMLTYNRIEPRLPEMQFGIADKATDDLTSDDIEMILDAIERRGSKVQKRRVFEVIPAMVNWSRTTQWTESRRRRTANRVSAS